MRKLRKLHLPTLVLCSLLTLTSIARCVYRADTSWFPAVARQCSFVSVLLLGNCFLGWGARGQRDSAVGWHCCCPELVWAGAVWQLMYDGEKLPALINGIPEPTMPLRLLCLDLMEDFCSHLRTVNEPAGHSSSVLLGNRQWRKWQTRKVERTRVPTHPT